VTVRTEQDRDGVDLELPGDRPIREWLPDLLLLMGLTLEGSALADIELRTEDGPPLAQGSSLSEAGVRNSDILWLHVGGGSAAASEGSAAVPLQEGPRPLESPGSAELEEAPLRDRLFKLGVIREPCLVGDRGILLMLGHPPIRIGRASRGHRPDIDLTELDSERTASRHHATIVLDGDTYQLVARPTTNGTLLNGRNLEPEVPQPLNDGDEIQFGAGGVLLTFYSGRASVREQPH
jgi:hypothetical protein